MADNVNHPAHYTAGNIEVIDLIENVVGTMKDPVAAYLTGQALKYLCRWDKKGGTEDLKKAEWYLNRLIRKTEGAFDEERCCCATCGMSFAEMSDVSWGDPDWRCGAKPEAPYVEPGGRCASWRPMK